MKVFTVKSLFFESHLNYKKISIECVIRKGIPSIKILGITHQKSNELAIKFQTIFAIHQINLPYENIQVNISSCLMKQYINHLDFSIFMSIFLTMNMEYIKIFEPIETTLFLGELSLIGDVEKIEDFKKHIIHAKKIGFNKIILSNKHYEESIQFGDIEYVFVNNIKDIFEKKFIISKGYTAINIERKNLDNIKIPRAIIKLLPVIAGKHPIYLIEKQNINKIEVLKYINFFLPELEPQEIDHLICIDKHNISRPYIQIPANISKKEFFGDKINHGILFEYQKGILLFENINSFHNDIIISLKELIENGQVKVNSLNFYVLNDYWIFITSKSCLCGNLYNPLKECTCTIKQIKNFYQKFKLILKDYIDVIYFIDHEYINLRKNIINIIQKNMNKAYEIQSKRYKNESFKFNAHIPDDKVEIYCHFENQSTEIYWEKITKYLPENERKIIRKIARTIADFNSNLRITIRDIQRSFEYRRALNYIEDPPIQQYLNDSLK